VRRVIEPGAAAYSTLTMLPDGRVALLYEGDDYKNITLAIFAPSWLGAGCP
jgi:sialidase-1